ncbi:type II secretion system major pseudopilin GspG [Legionella clemsonensis]|uniref:Type II secretion system protein G n=1 Tax=Legionella clemsonensis TaxID=1867846 RepID=A0A222NYD2_9GAMM|nr:type II secretion system major pseudopilin GspG [Legionella clemsonensis]ASQ44586.1 Type II secretion system protein G precursor [Legionella clemsonensis]
MQKSQVKNWIGESKGATVIEIILIIMLLVLLVAISLSIYFHLDWKESPEAIKEKKDILRLENAMRFYKLDNGFYPSSAQGLSALIKKPVIEPIPQHWVQYLKKIPNDPWGFAYHYSNPGRFRAVEIYSCGPTGKQNSLKKLQHWLTSNPKINCKS